MISIWIEIMFGVSLSLGFGLVRVELRSSRKNRT